MSVCILQGIRWLLCAIRSND